MDYYCLTSTTNKKQLDVVYFIPIPNDRLHRKGGVNGNEDVHLRTALVAYTKYIKKITTGDIESVIPNFSTLYPTMHAQFQTGELCEIVDRVKFNKAGWKRNKKEEKLDNKHTDLSISHVNKLKRMLKWWGYNRTISN